VNLSRLVPAAAQNGLQAIQITNSGLIALNANKQGYIYSLNGHHLYTGPADYEIAALNNLGDDVLEGPDVEIDVGGQIHSIEDINNVNENAYFAPYSINDAGEVAGSYVDSYHPQDTLGGYNLTAAEIFDADGTFVTQQGMVYVLGPPMPAFINDAGAMVYNLFGGGEEETINGQLISLGDYAQVYDSSTQAVTNIGGNFKQGTTIIASAINQSSQVVGTYFRGRSVSGFFLFDTATNTLQTIPTPAGEQAISAAISDDGTMVGTVQQTVRARGHVRSVNKAVIFSTSYGIEDLSSMVALPVGATLSSAQSVNDSGDILTECTLANGTELAFLLVPKSS
jgi:hypothetical protein